MFHVYEFQDYKKVNERAEETRVHKMNAFSFLIADRSCLDDILLIERYSFYPELYKSPRYYKRQISFKRLRLCVVDGEVVGYLCFQPHKQYVSISDLATKIGYRQKGVAFYLINSLLKELQNSYSKVKTIRLMVAADNDVEQSLYRKFYFIPKAVRKQYYGMHD